MTNTSVVSLLRLVVALNATAVAFHSSHAVVGWKKRTLLSGRFRKGNLSTRWHHAAALNHPHDVTPLLSLGATSQKGNYMDVRFTSSNDENVEPTDDFSAVCRYSERALLNCASETGMEALDRLRSLSLQRLPYQNTSFDKEVNGDSIVSITPRMLPPNVTEALDIIVETLEKEGCFSTNPDSVDGLPSFHLNLVSKGESVLRRPEYAEMPTPLQSYIQQILSLVEPYLYKTLLPHARRLVDDTSKKSTRTPGTLEISDVFLRRYHGRQDENYATHDDSHDANPKSIPKETPARDGISAHYDVFSRITSVIALDDAAANGDNGLYTTVVSPSSFRETTSGSSSNSQTFKSGNTSNHAALRRFFPLRTGDAVVHSWNVLHGVDVLPGIDRTSLIVWFTERNSNQQQHDRIVSPWLQNPTDNVGEFVLASAMESASSSSSLTSDTHDPAAVMVQPQDDSSMTYSTVNASSAPHHFRHHAHDLYLDSASSGNAFALSRLGSLLCTPDGEHHDIQQQQQTLTSARMERLHDILRVIRPKEPWFLVHILSLRGEKNDPDQNTYAIALWCWFEASVRGNPLAQLSLGDEVMSHAMSNSEMENHDLETRKQLRLLATTLFVMAAQQGNPNALDCVNRAIMMEMQCCETEEEFRSSEVLALAAFS